MKFVLGAVGLILLTFLLVLAVLPETPEPYTELAFTNSTPLSWEGPRTQRLEFVIRNAEGEDRVYPYALYEGDLGNRRLLANGTVLVPAGQARVAAFLIPNVRHYENERLTIALLGRPQSIYVWVQQP